MTGADMVKLVFSDSDFGYCAPSAAACQTDYMQKEAALNPVETLADGSPTAKKVAAALNDFFGDKKSAPPTKSSLSPDETADASASSRSNSRNEAATKSAASNDSGARAIGEDFARNLEELNGETKSNGGDNETLAADHAPVASAAPRLDAIALTYRQNQATAERLAKTSETVYRQGVFLNQPVSASAGVENVAPVPTAAAGQ
jgi:hypothetical protein